MKSYLAVKASDINSINYIFTDDSCGSQNDIYPLPKSMPIGGSSSKEIFDKYGIPEELQYVFMTFNPLKFKFNNKKETRQYNGKHSSMKGKELVIGAYVNISIGTDNFYGNMYSNKPAFEFKHANICKREFVLDFLQRLRSMDLMNNYIYAISDLFRLKVMPDIDYKRLIK